MSDFRMFAAIEFATPEDARVYMQTHVMTPRQKAALRRFIGQWEADLARAQIEHLTQRSDGIAAEHQANRKVIEACTEEAREIRRQVKSGRTTAEEAQRALTRLSRKHSEAMKIQASLTRAIESWEVASEQSATDRLREQQERFSGVPGLGRRTLTPAMLDGDQ